MSRYWIKEGLAVKYYADNTDTPYHIEPNLDPLSGTWLLNKGKLQYVPWNKMTKSYTYNDPGTFKYSATSYVPSYKDSIYLGIIGSKTLHSKI